MSPSLHLRRLVVARGSLAELPAGKPTPGAPVVLFRIFYYLVHYLYGFAGYLPLAVSAESITKSAVENNVSHVRSFGLVGIWFSVMLSASAGRDGKFFSRPVLTIFCKTGISHMGPMPSPRHHYAI